MVGENCSHAIEVTKSSIPSILSQIDLHIDLAKTEEYLINGEEKQREKCKYLGLILLTHNIDRHNQLATVAYINKILTHKGLVWILRRDSLMC